MSEKTDLDFDVCRVKEKEMRERGRSFKGNYRKVTK
jgi:hypothetical protein